MKSWYGHFNYRRLCELKREPKNDCLYLPLKLSQASFCLVETDNKTKIPFKSWVDKIFYILPAYWPKKFYIYYGKALKDWFESPVHQYVLRGHLPVVKISKQRNN